MTVSKNDLAREVSKLTGTTINAAESIVSAIFDAVGAHVAAGETVRITGFGSFSQKVRAPRTGRNPRTGEPVEIPESRTIGFKPSRSKSA